MSLPSKPVFALKIQTLAHLKNSHCNRVQSMASWVVGFPETMSSKRTMKSWHGTVEMTTCCHSDELQHFIHDMVAKVSLISAHAKVFAWQKDVSAEKNEAFATDIATHKTQ